MFPSMFAYNQSMMPSAPFGVGLSRGYSPYTQYMGFGQQTLPPQQQNPVGRYGQYVFGGQPQPQPQPQTLPPQQQFGGGGNMTSQLLSMLRGGGFPGIGGGGLSGLAFRKPAPNPYTYGQGPEQNLYNEYRDIAQGPTPPQTPGLQDSYNIQGGTLTPEQWMNTGGFNRDMQIYQVQGDAWLDRIDPGRAQFMRDLKTSKPWLFDTGFGGSSFGLGGGRGEMGGPGRGGGGGMSGSSGGPGPGQADI